MKIMSIYTLYSKYNKSNISLNINVPDLFRFIINKNYKTLNLYLILTKSMLSIIISYSFI